MWVSAVKYLHRNTWIKHSFREIVAIRESCWIYSKNDTPAELLQESEKIHILHLPSLVFIFTKVLQELTEICEILQICFYIFLFGFRPQSSTYLFFGVIYIFWKVNIKRKHKSKSFNYFYTMCQTPGTQAQRGPVIAFSVASELQRCIIVLK